MWLVKLTKFFKKSQLGPIITNCAQTHPSAFASRQKSFGEAKSGRRKDTPCQATTYCSSPWREKGKQKHNKNVQFEQHSLCPRNNKYIRASPKAICFWTLVRTAERNSRHRSFRQSLKAVKETESRRRETVWVSSLISSTWACARPALTLQLGEWVSGPTELYVISIHRQVYTKLNKGHTPKERPGVHITCPQVLAEPTLSPASP